jgi:hypothetical protein
MHSFLKLHARSIKVMCMSRHIAIRISIFFFFVLLRLTIGFGNTFNLILLLDGIRVGGSTSGVDEFFGQTFGHGFQVAETSLSCTSCQQIQSVVDAAKGRHINGLTTDNTGTTDSCGVFPWTRVDNGVHHNLDGVLVREKMDDFQCVLDNSASHELLSRVTALLHQAARKSLNNGATSLAETLLLVASGSVRKIRGMVTFARNVILKMNGRQKKRSLCNVSVHV